MRTLPLFQRCALCLILFGCGGDTEFTVVDVGDAAAREMDFRSAIGYYTEAIDSGTLQADALRDAYLKRGNAYLQEAELNTDADSDFIAALSDASRARELAPEISDAIDLQATVYQRLGGYPEALALFRISYEVDNSDPFWSLISIGETYRMMGDYETALRYYNHVLERSDVELGMPIYYHRALAFFETGRYREAVESINRGIRYQRDYPFAYVYRACAYGRLGEYARAFADYDFGLVQWRRVEPEYGRTTYWRTIRDRLVVEAAAARALSNGVTSDIAPSSFCGFPAHERHRERSSLLPPSSEIPILDFETLTKQ